MTTTTPTHHPDLHQLHEMSERLRRDSLLATSAAGSGHPTSCLSCAEILSVLFFDHLRFDPGHPEHPDNDQFVLSKGHAAPILWSVQHEAGLLADEDLLQLRKIDSDLEGHPTPRNPWVLVATGSLGQGLSMANGLAWAARHRGSGSHTFALLGDGETAEGSVWEAAALAAHQELSDLTAIIDINRFGQTGPTMLEGDSAVYRRRFEAFGWRAIEIDGHDVAAISEALDEARKEDGAPTVILARTEKGKGVEEIEAEEGKHGKPVESVGESLAQLDLDALTKDPAGELTKPRHPDPGPETREPVKLPDPQDQVGAEVSTREAFGDAMVRLGGRSEDVIALDGDVKNSTKLEAFFEAHESRSIQCFIAEQNMVGMAIGLDAAGLKPCVATFSAFLTRAFDQLRMAAISRARLMVAGSHCGVAIGEDGPSQMGLEDLAMMRTLPGALVLHPSDAVSTHRAVELAANHDGIAYLRLTRNSLPGLYTADAEFEAGGSQVHDESADDRVTLVGAGVSLHECLKARSRLAEQGVSARVVDCFSVKPIDSATLRRCASETRNLVVIEDHYAAGGLGEAVMSAMGDTSCRIRHLAVRNISRSGKPEELLDRHGISSRHIENEALALVA